MTATHFYDAHLFDAKVQDGLPLRGVLGTTLTVPSRASGATAGLSRKSPFIYTLAGMTLLSGLSWAGIVILVSHWV